MANLIVPGDSNGYGPPYAAAWAAPLAAALGRTLVQKSVSGAMAADQAFACYSHVPSATDIFIPALGTNDLRKYGTDATKIGYYGAFMRSLMLAGGLPARLTARSGGISFPVGAWSNTAVNTIGKYVDTVGAKAQATVNGTAVYIQYILQDSWGATINLKITIDGVEHFVTVAGVGMTTANGLAYAPGVLRFGGLTLADHLVTIETLASSGFRFYLDYIAGSTQAVKPRVIVPTTPRMTSAGYAASGVGSDAAVAAINAVILADVANFVTDGLNMQSSDIGALINPTTDLDGGGAHYAASGAGKVKTKLEADINGPPPPPPEFTYRDATLKICNENGKVFAVDGSTLIELTRTT